MIEFKRQDYVRYWPDNLDPQNFTFEQRRFLAQLNVRLSDIEKGIKQEAIQLLNALERRVIDSDNYLEDYEIDCYVTFFIGKDDPDYGEDEDNVLVQLWENLKGENWVRELSDGNNHNEFEGWSHHPMKDETHCWLYHALYDHTEHGWRNILRIGTIQVDLEVDYRKSWDIR